MREVEYLADGYEYIFEEGGLEHTIIEIYNGNNKELKQYQLSDIFGVAPSKVRLVRYALSLAGLLTDEFGEPVPAFAELDQEVDYVLHAMCEGASIIEIANTLNISTTTVNRMISAWNIVLEWRGEKAPSNNILEEMEVHEAGTVAVPREEEQLSLTELFEDNPVPTVALKSARVHRLKDGTYSKSFTYNPQIAQAEVQLHTYDELNDVINNFAPEKPRLHTDGTLTEVFALSDVQLGKAHETGGGSKETIERVLQAAYKFKERILRTKPVSVIITDLGDGIENINNTPQQLCTNDLELGEQIRCFRRLMLEVIKIIAPYAPKVYVVAVPSNHGEIRNGSRKPTGTPENDYGIEISFQLQDICENAEQECLRNIEFVRPANKQLTAVIDLENGSQIAFNHGHKAQGGIQGQEAWWKNQCFAEMPGSHANIMVMGHFHNHQVMQTGGKRWLISCAASEPSSDYFSSYSGKSSVRGVTTFAVNEKGVPVFIEVL